VTQALTAKALTDPFAQYQYLVALRARKPTMTQVEYIDEVQATTRFIARCQGAVDDHAALALLLRVLDLPQEDMFDALRYDPKANEAFALHNEEGIYPTSGPGFLGRYVKWARPGNAPMAYHVWSGLTVLGAAAQRRIFFPGARRVFMNMYMMLGGHRSTGKGQAFDAAVKMLDCVNDEVNRRADLTVDDRRSMRVNILPSDSTMESLITGLAQEVGHLVERLPGEEEGNPDDPGAIRVGPDMRPIDATGILPLDELATWFGEGS
jgi:hypothetical protein